MGIQLTGIRLQVYEYLKKIAPEWATFDDIQRATSIQPPQLIFQIIKLLTSYGMIVTERGHFRENEWAFSIQPSLNSALDLIPQARVGPASKVEFTADPAEDPFMIDFERRALTMMSRLYEIPFHKAVPAGVPKIFSLVSTDGEVIGESVYFPPGEGINHTRARCSVITENVWLLEKARAKRKFLVFSGQRETLHDWLGRFGTLVNQIEFYLLTEEGQLENIIVEK